MATAALLAAAAAGAAAECPAACPDATAFCQRTFGVGLGATVAAENCTIDRNNSFVGTLCVCNDLATIQVELGRQIGGGGAGVPMCTWPEKGFEPAPVPWACTRATGRCAPVDLCDNATHLAETFAPVCYGPPTCRRDNATNTTRMRCESCPGAAFLEINSTFDGGNCVRAFTTAAGVTMCDPYEHCGGHGCCTLDWTTQQPVCTCYDDDVHGHFRGEACDACTAPMADIGLDPTCKTPVDALRFVSELRTRPSAMTLPTMLVALLVVGLLMVRKRWASDEEVYMLPPRKPNGKLFRAKIVPKRPAGSRGMANRAELAKQEALRRGFA